MKGETITYEVILARAKEWHDLKAQVASRDRQIRLLNEELDALQEQHGIARRWLREFFRRWENTAELVAWAERMVASGK